MAVGVGVHQPRNQQTLRRIEGAGVLGRGHARRPELADRIALDEDVRRFDDTAAGVEHAPAPYHLVGSRGSGHRLAMLPAGLPQPWLAM